MGMTQSLLAVIIADSSPPDLRGTAYGLFSLVSGPAAGQLWCGSALDNMGSRLHLNHRRPHLPADPAVSVCDAGGQEIRRDIVSHAINHRNRSCQGFIKPARSE